MKAWQHPDGTISVQPTDDGLPAGVVEVEPPPPAPPRIMPQELWQLFTVPEHVAARAANDATVAVAFDRINARREPLSLDDGYFLALVSRLVAPLGVLTEARALQVIAGVRPDGGGNG